MEFMLKIRAWKLFLLLIVVPAALLYVSYIPDVDRWFGLPLFFLSWFLHVGLYLVWVFSIGAKLSYKVPLSQRMTGLQVTLVPSILGFLALWTCLNFKLQIYRGEGFLIKIGPIVSMLYLISGGFFLYWVFLNALTLKAAEKGREAGIRESADEFFLLWFFPIGIWFLQPRINRLVESGGAVSSGVK